MQTYRIVMQGISFFFFGEMLNHACIYVCIYWWMLHKRYALLPWMSGKNRFNKSYKLYIFLNLGEFRVKLIKYFLNL
jgi:hypothetical protein